MEFKSEELRIQEMKKRRVAVFSFGTRGDVLPVAVVADSLARADRSASITFITHEAHRDLETRLARSGVAFVGVSAPPVLPGRTAASSEAEIGHSSGASEDDDRQLREALEMELREECLTAMDSVMGAADDAEGNAVIFNFFALEGWHLAELYRVPCTVLAPYVVPYSAPSSFERRFRAAHPLLYRRLQEAAPGEVGWKEVMHWMWPLFTDRWAEWRLHRLHLSACPLTDPVTDLPLVYEWPQAPHLLYGFSSQVVECPAYWPSSISVCGFWFTPLEWDVAPEVNPGLSVVQAKPKSLKGPASFRGAPLDLVVRQSCLVTETLQHGSTKKRSYKPPVKLGHFLSEHKFDESENKDDRPIFLGFSSTGNMGFLERPGSMLKVLKAVLEATDSSAILFTAGHPPLDLEVTELCDENLSTQYLEAEQKRNLLQEGLCCFNGRLFCYSGSVPYLWLLPHCSVAIHHGGSGTTAACLRAGTPQIICPFVLDQFYWAERMTWLRVAPQSLTPQLLMPDMSSSENFHDAVKVISAAIREARSVEMKLCASSLSVKLEGEDGTSVAVSILRTLLCK